MRLPATLPFDFRTLERLSISACGTAYYAGLVAKYWFERFARLPVEIDVASEFRYREAPLDAGGLAIFVSQSGETADTLASLRYAKEQKQHVARGRQRADLDDRARKRRGDADARRPRDRRRLDQGVHLPARGARLPRDRGRPRARRAVGGGRAQAGARADRGAAPHGARRCSSSRRSSSWRATSSKSRDVLYLGRGTSYPLALEGALKLKEISYIHAEGYAAGELKHGPIALIDETMPVIVIAPYDRRVREDRLQHAGGRGARRPDHPGHRPEGRARGARWSRWSTLDAAGDAGHGDAARLCHSGAAASPITRRSSWAPTSTSRATSRSRSRSSDRPRLRRYRRSARSRVSQPLGCCDRDDRSCMTELIAIRARPRGRRASADAVATDRRRPPEPGRAHPQLFPHRPGPGRAALHHDLSDLVVHQLGRRPGAAVHPGGLPAGDLSAGPRSRARA